jgi:putative salt-induced outer membrane protein YdiY
MVPFRARALTLAALAALAARAVAAQDAPPVRLTVDLGFVDASGNSDVTTFNFGEKAAYATGRWTLSQLAAVIYGETDGSSTAEQYDAGLRAEYSLGPHFAAFAGVDWNRNTFAGISSRFVEGAGLAWKAVQAARDSLRIEAAITSNQEANLALVRNTFAASRGALAYKHAFGASTAFTQTLELITNLEDTDDQRVNSETALTAPISRQIALKAAYVLRFDNQPEPTKKDTDRVFTTGLQIVF